MRVLSTSDSDIREAAEALRAGKRVAFPTETVYGLGADAFNTASLAGVFEAKGRPRFDPLIVHIAELQGLSRLVDYGALRAAARSRLDALAAALWPGPLTLILPKLAVVPDLATAGLPTVAVRFPRHPVAQKLIALSTGAVAAPSANAFGRLSPTTAAHVAEQLGGKVDYIVDGGASPVGLESTVLDLCAEPPRILRPGGAPREDIEAVIGPVEWGSEAGATQGGLKSPGSLKSHYAPRTPLVLYPPGELAALPEKEGEGRLYFKKPPDCGSPDKAASPVRFLSAAGDAVEAAARLFAVLHELDALGLKIIRAEAAPETGLGPAITDRLTRAAARKKYHFLRSTK